MILMQRSVLLFSLFLAGLCWADEVESKAKAGDAKAQCELGLRYSDGKGVPKDLAQAADWYRKAAEQGLAEAQSKLAGCYFHGEGVEKDPIKTLAWCRKAAEQGYARAQINLGMFCVEGLGMPADLKEAVTWFRKAADQGDAEAQCILARCYARGAGLDRDDVEAVAWYRKAADQGIAEAQCNLGNAYELGLGVAQDPAEAVAWYRKAADQGHAEGQAALALCYDDGLGLPQDLSQAMAWYRKAASQGSEEAKAVLERLKEPVNERPMHWGCEKTPEVLEVDRKFIQTLVTECGSREKGSVEMVRRGWDCLDRKDFGIAMKRFNQAWLLDDKNAQAYWGMGAVLGKKGKLVDSAVLLRRAAACDPKNVRILVDFAHVLKALKCDDRASVVMGQATKIDPAAPSMHPGEHP